MKLLILLGLVAAASAISFLDVSKEEWNNFKVSKSHSSSILRKKIYLSENLLRRAFSNDLDLPFWAKNQSNVDTELNGERLTKRRFQCRRIRMT